MVGMQAIVICTQLGLSLLAVISLIIFMAHRWWFADLLTHFTVQYALAALTAGLLLGAIKYGLQHPVTTGWLIVAVLLSVWHGGRIYHFLQQSQTHIAHADTPADARVMSLNLLAYNRHYERVQAHIDRVSPDILLLIEVQPHHIEGLNALSERYPFHEVIPAENSFGIALYSRYPLTHLATQYWGARRIPYITATIAPPNAPSFDLYGVHLRPPIGAHAAEVNMQQAKEVVAQMDGQRPALLLGDFNTTPWSARYRTMMAGTRLMHPYKGWGLGTWMPHLLGGLIIDHIFVQHMQVLDWQMGPNIGSDHRSVSADIVIPRREARNARAD
jgi:endonuclease/exonuclease/phosphatase (EEP) superfamily protein YafD